MKLNTKRTVLVGFAFFLICAFWGAYEPIVPLILKDKFEMSNTWSGVIMALDNVFAVFMLPIFGAMSDKFRSKYGKRTPFIFFGTIFGAVFLALLGVADQLWLFIVILLAALVSMAVFRSPAVALMPDVTPKPLRSKGNAVINLMGTAGGIVALGLAALFKTSTPGKTDFFLYLLAVSVLMIAALVVFMLTVKEPLWSAEAEEINKKIDEEAEAELAAEEKFAENGENDRPKGKLSGAERISLILILASVVLWFTGYNAVTSKYSVYARDVLGVDHNTTLLVAQAAAVISYIPVGILSSKFGRKRAILAGIIMLTAAFTAAAFITKETPGFVMYILFSLAGIGWATINVNSFPMVVELARHGDTGRYTGYYYTASMAAQIVTPILSGFLIDHLPAGWAIFFPYAAIFTALSFVTMLFVRHGDSKPEEKQSILEHLDVED